MEFNQQSDDLQHEDEIQEETKNDAEQDQDSDKDSLESGSLEEIEKSETSKWRVKVYKLNKQGGWDDISTGFVQVAEYEGQKYIEMTSENDPESKFSISIRDNIFKKQRGSIISWRSNDSPDKGEDGLALSFQDKQATVKIWEFICQVHNMNENSDTPPQEPQEDGLSEVQIYNLPLIAREIRPENSNQMFLQKVIEKLTDNQGKYLLELNELFYKEEKCILESEDIEEGKKTMAITNDYADLNDYEEYEAEEESYNLENKQDEQNEEEAHNRRYLNISLIFTIYKNILSIANYQIIELLMSDSHYLGTFACLECKGFKIDDLESAKCIPHRKFLTETANFKNILKIEDEAILGKIQYAYRLMYLRDVAIVRFIEEQTLRLINIQIQQCYIDIVTYLMQNKTYIQNLFALLSAKETEYQAILFIREALNIVKEIIHLRTPFIEILFELGMLNDVQALIIEHKPKSEYAEVVKSKMKKSSGDYLDESSHKPENRDCKESILDEILLNESFDDDISNDQSNFEDSRQEDPKAGNVKDPKAVCNKSKTIYCVCIEILIHFLHGATHTLRQTIIGQLDSKSHLMNICVYILFFDDNFGYKYEIAEIIKSLFDIQLENNKYSLIDIFLEKYIQTLFNYIKMDNDFQEFDLDELTASRYSVHINESKQLIMEILTFAGNFMPGKLSWYLENFNLLDQIHLILRHNKFLDLFTVKLIKSLLCNGEENTVRQILSDEKTLGKVLDIISQTEKSKNILYSCCLDLFYCIKNTPFVNLICNHLIGNFKVELTRLGLLYLVYDLKESRKEEKTQEINKSQYKFFGMSSIEKASKEEEDYFSCEENEDEPAEREQVQSRKPRREDGHSHMKTYKNFNDRIFKRHENSRPMDLLGRKRMNSGFMIIQSYEEENYDDTDLLDNTFSEYN